MFAEGARYQEEISAVGPSGKIECHGARARALLAGPSRRGRRSPQVIVSPRDPKGPRMVEIPVDPALLAAGDHNGSTFYQHQGFNAVARGQGRPEVSLTDGWWAVAMGMAAQKSAATGQAVLLADEVFTPR